MEKIIELVTKIQQEQQAVGLIAATFDKTGKILYEQTFGYKDKDQQTIIDTDTIFGIASMSKSFTALAIMQLVERGVVDLEAPVVTYIPEFKNTNQETVLVKHLLSHSAGYYPQHRTTIYEVAAYLGIDPKQSADLAYDNRLAIAGASRVCSLLDAAKNHCGIPGEITSYSNDSYGLLSEIIRRMGNEATYAEYIENNIFAPLGMKRSTIAFLQPQKDMNSATLYYNVGDEQIATHDYYENAFVLHGGGAVKSTMNDLIAYVCMYLNNGATSSGQLCQSDTITEMTYPHIPFTYTSDYGYGLTIQKIDNQQVVGHGGSLTGVSSQMLWVPDLGIGAIVLCNTSNVTVAPICETLITAVSQLKQIKIDYPPVVWQEVMLDQVCGVYKSDEGDGFNIILTDKKTQIFSVETFNDEQRYVGVARPISDCTLIMKKQYNDVVFEFIYRNNQVIAVKMGGRILPRQEQ